MKPLPKHISRAVRRVRLSRVLGALVFALWFSLYPSRAAYSWDSQNVNWCADSGRIIFDCFFNKSFCIVGQSYATIPREIFRVGSHCRILPEKINFTATQPAIFGDETNGYIFVPVHFKINFVHNQYRIFNASKYYCEYNAITSFKVIAKSGGIPTSNFGKRIWQIEFDIFNRFINIDEKSFVTLEGGINYSANIKTSIDIFQETCHCIELSKYFFYFTGNDGFAGIVLKNPLAIGGNNNFIVISKGNDGCLSDSTIVKKKNKQEEYKKPSYMRLTKRGLSTEMVIGHGWPVFGLDGYDVDVSTDECKTWFHLFDDRCVNGLPNYFTVKDSLKLK